MTAEEWRRFAAVGGLEQFSLRPAAGDCVNCGYPIEEAHLLEGIAGGGTRPVVILVHRGSGREACPGGVGVAERSPAGTPSGGGSPPGGDEGFTASCHEGTCARRDLHTVPGECSDATLGTGYEALDTRLRAAFAQLPEAARAEILAMHAELGNGCNAHGEGLWCCLDLIGGQGEDTGVAGGGAGAAGSAGPGGGVGGAGTGGPAGHGAPVADGDEVDAAGGRPVTADVAADRKRREELWRRWGRPEPYPLAAALALLKVELVTGDAMAYRYASADAACAFAEANMAAHGWESVHAETSEGVIGVVFLPVLRRWPL